MPRVLIVDDELAARERMKKLLSLHSDIEIAGEASDGIEALEKIKELKPDIVFLDIEMPELNGLEVAKSLGDDGPSIVFVTAYNEHALEAFEAAAMDYLVKPVVPERLQKAVSKVSKTKVESLGEVQTRLGMSPKLALKVGAKFEVFDAKNISAIIAKDHYAAVVVGERELYSEDSLESLAGRLSGEFLRVHRSAIINLDFLQELKRLGDRKYLAVLNDLRATEVLISRERLAHVKKALKISV